jgi:hypothetical protein
VSDNVEHYLSAEQVVALYTMMTKANCRGVYVGEGVVGLARLRLAHREHESLFTGEYTRNAAYTTHLFNRDGFEVHRLGDNPALPERSR